MNASLRNQVSGILPLRAALFISKASVVRLVGLVVGSDGPGNQLLSS